MPAKKMKDAHSAESCNDCPLESRRDFFKQSALLIGAVAAATGLTAERAQALAITFATGRRGAATDVTYPVPAADGVTIDNKNDVMLARTQGQVIAFNLSCPHQNTALRWNGDAQQFQCPKHKSIYKPDGTFISGRATRNMDRLAIRKDGDNVVVDVDQMFKQDENQAGWDAAVVKL
jgi:nitrite reductase/ring-hydroxylating ferredoxin subunit